jgi:hypothetical protein
MDLKIYRKSIAYPMDFLFLVISISVPVSFCYFLIPFSHSGCGPEPHGGSVQLPSGESGENGENLHHILHFIFRSTSYDYFKCRKESF